MCARRFLLFVFWMILIFVAGAFGIYQFGSSILARSATPAGHYAAPPPRSGPDYSKAASWLARPGLAGDQSTWLPDGMAAPPGEKRAAVFYIHPTTYLQSDRWNARADEPGQAAINDALFVRSQASAFNGIGETWAPRYRQAAFGAFLLKSDDATKALDLAFGDVLAAFDRFIADQPKDRPIILAGHSQGALHLSRLLVDRRGVLKGRIVAAYVVGWPLSVSADLPATGLAPCARPDQTGCVLSWMSFAEPANPSIILGSWLGTEGRGGKRAQADLLCVNPLTGTRNGAATVDKNPGTLVPTADFASATLLPGAVGARCDEGLLKIGGTIPQMGPFVLPGNNYHAYDYALFWGAIRADAARRLAAWH